MLFLSNVGFFQGDLSNSTANILAHVARYSEKQWVRVLLGGAYLFYSIFTKYLSLSRLAS